MSIFPYDLTLKESNSDKYFETIADISDRLILDAEINLAGIVNDFEQFLQKENITSNHTRLEHLIDIFMIGTLWNMYISNAMASKFIFTQFAQALSSLKPEISEKNKEIEKLKNQIINEFLIKHSDEPPTADLHNYKLLLDWLISVSFFNEEVMRMMHWEKYFDNLDEKQISYTLNYIINYIFDFSDNIFNQLHNYTSQVIDFLECNYIDNSPSDDIIMRERNEEEYHLNMFANYLLNKVQKEAFKAKTKKIILLPNCLKESDSNSEGLNKHSCNSNKVIKIIKELNNPNIEVVTIPHKEFSKFYLDYTGSKDTAILPVTCVLNLLSTSLELRRLNISHQVMPLDYSGCKKYWDKEGMPSSVNINKLVSYLI